MTRRLVALAVIDAGALLLGVLGGMWVGAALALHAGLSALSFATWLRGGGRIGFAAAILGVFGPLGVLVARPFRGGAIASRADEAVFGAARKQTAHRGADLKVARMLDGRVHHAAPETLGSLVTIMRHGDVPARRRALETVVRSFEPALSPLIALALTDGDQTIRALAAAASARVGQNLVRARATLEARDGDDPATAATLAALLADHARADVLLSDSQRAHLRDDAVAAIAGDPAARDALAIEAYWAAGDYAAIDRLVAAMPVGPDGDAVARWWRSEAAA